MGPMDLANEARSPAGASAVVGAAVSRPPSKPFLRGLHMLKHDARDKLKERRLPDAPVSVDHLFLRTDHPEWVGLHRSRRVERERLIVGRATANLWVRKPGTKPKAWVTHHFSRSPIVASSIACRALPSGNTVPTGLSFSACAQMKTGSCFTVRTLQRLSAGDKIVNRDVARAFDRWVHEQHQVGEFRRHYPNRC